MNQVFGILPGQVRGDIAIFDGNAWVASSKTAIAPNLPNGLLISHASTAAITITGTHTYGIDVSGGTYTSAWHGGFTVDDLITITRATALSFILFVGTGTGATTWGEGVDNTGAFSLAEIGVGERLHVSKGTPGANFTSLSVLEGATPTIRRLKTFDPGAAGINFTAGQLVCVLV